MSLLKESLSERRAAQAAVSSSVVAASPAATLVVSIWEGETWVLPWSQLVNARFRGPGGHECLELAFPHCVVAIKGRRLRGLLDDLAAFRIACLRDFPPDYRPSPEAGEPFITKIEVRGAVLAGGSKVESP